MKLVTRLILDKDKKRYWILDERPILDAGWPFLSYERLNDDPCPLTSPWMNLKR
jgi:hypothetical protein